MINFIDQFKYIPRDIREWNIWLRSVDNSFKSKVPISEWKFKTSDSSKSTDTTLADDDHLIEFALKKNTYYALEAHLTYTQNVGDFKYDFVFSQSLQSGVISMWVVDQSSVTFADYRVISAGQGFTTLTDGDDISITFRGYFLTNQDNDGEMDFQWAQNTSSANNTTLYEGSWIKIWRLGDA